MAHLGLAALLLFLGLGLSPVYGADLGCEILNSTVSNSSISGFTLTVSPDTLSGNTTHTVTLTGSGNFTVILQALNGSTAVGNWSERNSTCNGNPLFQNVSGTIQANWTSPEGLTFVNISAHIGLDNATTYIVFKILSRAANTTAAPTTTTTTTTTTVTTAATTHNGASTLQTSLTTMAFLGLLTVTSKYLS